MNPKQPVLHTSPPRFARRLCLCGRRACASQRRGKCGDGCRAGETSIQRGKAASPPLQEEKKKKKKERESVRNFALSCPSWAIQGEAGRSKPHKVVDAAATKGEEGKRGRSKAISLAATSTTLRACAWKPCAEKKGGKRASELRDRGCRDERTPCR
jgi:hypothetical protein